MGCVGCVPCVSGASGSAWLSGVGSVGGLLRLWVGHTWQDPWGARVLDSWRHGAARGASGSWGPCGREVLLPQQAKSPEMSRDFAMIMIVKLVCGCSLRG